MPNLPLKAVAVATALSLGALAMTPQAAEAKSKAPAIIGGIAAGALIAGAIANSNRRNYGPPPGYYAPPPPPVSYRYAPPPWSPEWYNYCSQKYRSFDPQSGTYQPYNGPRRFCQ